MILTTCAACAAPLAHNAPRCVRCQTRYCNKTCQHDHWRRGHSELIMLDAQNKLANTLDALGRHEEALQIERDIYSGRVKLNGEEHRKTLIAASGYATSLQELKRFEEAKSLLRKTLPVAPVSYTHLRAHET